MTCQILSRRWRHWRSMERHEQKGSLFRQYLISRDEASDGYTRDEITMDVFAKMWYLCPILQVCSITDRIAAHAKIYCYIDSNRHAMSSQTPPSKHHAMQSIKNRSFCPAASSPEHARSWARWSNAHHSTQTFHLQSKLNLAHSSPDPLHSSLQFRSHVSAHESHS